MSNRTTYEIENDIVPNQKIWQAKNLYFNFSSISGCTFELTVLFVSDLENI